MSRISEREFVEWHAYLQREPTGPERIEYMLAVVASTVLNATGRMKPPAKVKDFLPQWGPPKRQTKAEMKHLMMMASQAAENATKKREQRKPKK